MYKSILKFVRLPIMITCYAFVFVGSAAAGAITFKTVLAIFALIAWYIHAASTNDYSDRYIDAINLKDATDRPLVSQDISFKQLWVIHGVSGVLALVFSAFYGIGAVIIAVGMLATDYAYSLKPLRISDRGAISQFVLSVGYVYFPFSLGYWANGTSIPYPWLLSFGLYLGFVGRLFLKDFRDVKGDREHGKLTFILRHGVGATCLASAGCWIMAMLIVCKIVAFTPSVMAPLGLGVILVSWMLYGLSKATGTNQQYMISLIAQAANVSVITILTYLLCLNASGLSHTELAVIPFTVGIVFTLLIFFKYQTFIKSIEATSGKRSVRKTI